MRKVFNLDSDDEDDMDEDEVLDPFAEDEGESETRTKRSDKGGVDAPIANADSIPLFEDADKRGIRTADYIKVHKLDMPGQGYKGQIPLTSTMETIAQVYGNGLYRFDVCNAKHRVMRSKENVRIDIPRGQIEKTTNGKTSGELGTLDILKEVNRGHAQDIERTRLDAKALVDQTKQNSEAFVQLITTLTQASSQREREFLSAGQVSQQEFFKGMMTAQGQQFTQMMGIMVLSHQQTIESIKASQATNNPLTMVQVLMHGLAMGKNLGGDDDEMPDWLKAFSMGKDVLTDLAKIKFGANPLIPSAIPTKEATPEATPPTSEKKRPKNKLINENELKALITLKKSLLKRGIELESLLVDANKHYIADPSTEQKSDEKLDDSSDDESEDDLEDNDDSSPQSNVGGEES